MFFVRYIYLVALVLWVGSILFFSFVIAPVVFQVLPREQAGALTSAVFPIYYAVGCGCGLALLVASFFLSRSSPHSRALRAATYLVGAMLAVNLYAAVLVQPRAAALRPAVRAAEGPSAEKQEFDRLHRLAVILNGVVLVGGLTVIGFTASSLRS